MTNEIKPKVLYILPTYSPTTETHFYHLFELLEIIQKEVDLYLLIEHPVKTPPKLTCHIWLQKSSNPFLNLLERTVLILKARLIGCKVAYVHYSYWGAIISSTIFRISFGKTYYWHCEWYEKFGSPISLINLRKKITDEWPMRLAIKSVTKLITGSKSLKEFYSREFHLSQTKILVIPNWINLDRFKRSKSNYRSKNTVLFVHKLSPRKGVEFLPEIVERVAAKIKNVKFLIVGDGPSKLWLSKAFAQKNRRIVKFLGAVPNREIGAVFQKSTLFIMPSRQEGFPRVLLEAFGTGTPFVAFDIGGVKDMVSKLQKNYLIPPYDVKAFSDRIVDLLKNAKVRNKIAVDGQKQVSNYDIKIISKEFIKLFCR